jgi:hypothetical protein
VQSGCHHGMSFRRARPPLNSLGPTRSRASSSILEQLMLRGPLPYCRALLRWSLHALDCIACARCFAYAALSFAATCLLSELHISNCLHALCAELPSAPMTPSPPKYLLWLVCPMLPLSLSSFKLKLTYRGTMFSKSYL